MDTAGALVKHDAGRRNQGGSSTGQNNQGNAKSVPAFLNKLYAMVNDPETEHLIRWSPAGDSFLVPAPDQFARQMLPRYFKHSNFGSFVRQLNMYGFSKVMHLQQGVLKTEASDESEMLEFRNENFQKDQPDLLCYIHRKKSEKAAGQDERALLTAGPSSGGDGQSSALALDLRTILSDIAAIRKHQTSISTELKDVATSNKQLWSEAVASRERHQRHQDTINKIVRFLGEVFGGKVVEASDLGQGGPTAQDTSPSAGSSPDSNGDAGASHAQNHQPRRAHRRRLLIKGPEEQPGSGQITEIEVPDDDEVDALPTISGDSSAVEQPEGSTFASTSAPNGETTSAMLPSPIASPTHQFPFNSSSNGFPGLSAPDTNRGQILLPFLQQGASSGFTPPPSFSGPDPAQEHRIEKSQRDYKALESEMVNLQSKIDRLIAQLPSDQQSQLKDSAALGTDNQLNTDNTDFDTFLSQLATQQPDQQSFNQGSTDNSFEWILNNSNGANQDMYNFNGLSDQNTFNGFSASQFQDQAEQPRFDDFTNSAEFTEDPQFAQQQQVPPEIEVEEVEDASSPAANATAEDANKGKKRTAGTRSSARKKTKT